LLLLLLLLLLPAFGSPIFEPYLPTRIGQVISERVA